MQVVGDWWLVSAGAEAPAVPPFRYRRDRSHQSPTTNHPAAQPPQPPPPLTIPTSGSCGRT